ncbi:alpha-2-glucosyltransferase Alg10 [Phlyctochytrium arcticum]|nr:alpha-2-glucosyltransferase Alg10 [Phlyctochytrium arcticum]
MFSKQGLSTVLPPAFFFTLLMYPTFHYVKYIQTLQPTPYMDEIFHIPQSQAYCANRWSDWDDKLTTLPGLYLLSNLLIRLTHSACTVETLRLHNVFLLGCLFWVVGWASPGTGWKKWWNAGCVCCLPFLWFFAGLYYTDVGSTVFVMAGVGAAMRGNSLLSALLGAVGVLFRQTNIIWVAYSAGTIALTLLSHLPDPQTARPVSVSLSNLSVPSILRTLWVYRTRFVAALWPFVCILGLFAGFVVVNGGIVVGDKTNHVATVHIPQVFYYVLVLWGFEGPLVAYEAARKFVKGAGIGQFATFGALTGFVAWSLHHYTIEHPFLLSDNRHYPFYLYRRLLKPFRYALSPVYALGLVMWITSFEWRDFPTVVCVCVYACKWCTLGSGLSVAKKRSFHHPKQCHARQEI